MEALSPYVGPLAFGGSTDRWNSAAVSAWPLTPESLNNSRSSLVYSDGSPLGPQASIQVQGLGQYWDAYAHGPSQFGLKKRAFETWSYSDLPEPGLVTLSGLAAGNYDVVAYSPPTIPSFQTAYRVRVQRGDGRILYQTEAQATSAVNDDQKLTDWREGVQFVLFRDISLTESDQLVIQIENGKKHFSALQLIPKGSAYAKKDLTPTQGELNIALPSKGNTPIPSPEGKLLVNFLESDSNDQVITLKSPPKENSQLERRDVVPVFDIAPQTNPESRRPARESSIVIRSCATEICP